MPRKQLFFYATRADLMTVITMVEAEATLIYHKTGSLQKEALQSWPSLLHDQLGIAESGDNMNLIAYLVMEAGTQPEVRVVPQRSGGERHIVDELNNPASITFAPGGQFEPAQSIIQGHITSANANKTAMALFNLFSKALKATFIRGGVSLVGKEAMAYYNQGWRLTQNVKSPKEYDFQVTAK